MAGTQEPGRESGEETDRVGRSLCTGCARGAKVNITQGGFLKASVAAVQGPQGGQTRLLGGTSQGVMASHVHFIGPQEGGKHIGVAGGGGQGCSQQASEEGSTVVQGGR